MEKIILPVETDASGDAVVEANKDVKGFIHRVDWIGSGLAATVDATLKEINTPSGIASRTLLTLTDSDDDLVVRLRVLDQGADGADLATTSKPYIDGKLQLTVAQGGNTLSGRMVVYIE